MGGLLSALKGKMPYVQNEQMLVMLLKDICYKSMVKNNRQELRRT